jgi:hypothetical protein
VEKQQNKQKQLRQENKQMKEKKTAAMPFSRAYRGLGLQISISARK